MLRCATPGTHAISCAASTPRAVSIAGTSGNPPARAATHSTSSADSHFGIRIAAACGATASRSAAHSSVRGGLTRTSAACSLIAAATIARARTLASSGTPSSRSRITASAPTVNTRCSSLALWPGAKR